MAQSRYALSLPALFLLWLSLVPFIISAYKIDVPAAKKECFFEDLHENDKARLAI
jgi:hypothetical protein